MSGCVTPPTELVFQFMRVEIAFFLEITSAVEFIKSVISIRFAHGAHTDTASTGYSLFRCRATCRAIPVIKQIALDQQAAITVISGSLSLSSTTFPTSQPKKL